MAPTQTNKDCFIGWKRSAGKRHKTCVAKSTVSSYSLLQASVSVQVVGRRVTEVWDSTHSTTQFWIYQTIIFKQKKVTLHSIFWSHWCHWLLNNPPPPQKKERGPKCQIYQMWNNFLYEPLNLQSIVQVLTLALCHKKATISKSSVNYNVK